MNRNTAVYKKKGFWEERFFIMFVITLQLIKKYWNLTFLDNIFRVGCKRGIVGNMLNFDVLVS